MYICPTCQREFATEESVVKHFLACWKEQNPMHKSNEAPHSPDVECRIMGDSVGALFERLGVK